MMKNGLNLKINKFWFALKNIRFSSKKEKDHPVLYPLSTSTYLLKCKYFSQIWYEKGFLSSEEISPIRNYISKGIECFFMFFFDPFDKLLVCHRIHRRDYEIGLLCALWDLDLSWSWVEHQFTALMDLYVKFK